MILGNTESRPTSTATYGGYPYPAAFPTSKKELDDIDKCMKRSCKVEFCI